MSFIDNLADAHDFPAGLVLRVLGMAESTYYDQRARKVAPSRRELDDAALLEQILKVPRRAQFAGTYGSPESGWNCAAKACGSGANGSSGSCANTGCRAPTYGAGGRAARPGRTPPTPRRRTWSNATSGQVRRIGCGWPT